jgi:hypothetical protein
MGAELQAQSPTRVFVKTRPFFEHASRTRVS